MIAIESVRHLYPGDKLALGGIDLEIGPGVFGLLGPNGAGKTTLMRIVSTLLVATAGRVSVGGHDVVRERRAVRSLLGYLPQEFGAWRLFRVTEVLDTLAALSGIRDRGKRRDRVRRVVGDVGLEEVAERKVKQLSGGMVRRLGLAQALVHEPKVLILDEPTVGLDPEERVRFRRLMSKLGEDRTVILSTHIVSDLGSGCREVAVLDRGAIAFRGSPAELVAAARGQIFEVQIAAGREEELRATVEIVSRTTSEEGVRIRGLAPGGTWPAEARPVEEPTLEEAYLAVMAAGDGSLPPTEEETA